MKNQILLLKKAFTLIEVIMGVLIFAIVLIGGFKAYSGVLIGKIKLVESTDIQKEAFYFSEKFFEEIKLGGTIDYEEYFNRLVVGTLTQSGHYDIQSGFGNFGGTITGANPYGLGFYYCRSGSGTLMGTGGCYNQNAFRDISGVAGEKQRYGEYAIQFIDYNSNQDDDGGFFGDEDRDGNIIGDDDDEYLGEGPIVFTGGEDVAEIYLISANKDKRTYFRWNIKDDPNDPNNNCDSITGIGGCASTIEFLKLDGEDYGLNHDKVTGSGIYDGVIDSWFVNEDFSGSTGVLGGTGSVSYWQPLFGDNINVSDVKFFMYPNKDLKLAWKDSKPSTNIAPYVRIQMTLSPTYNARRGIKGKVPEVKINTTISLTDIYSR